MKFRSLALLGFALTLVAFAPHQGTAPARWALIVGISDYQNFGDEQGGDLPGARNDALAFQSVLMARYGFQERNIRLLLDTAATRARIVDALAEWLPAVVKNGDLVVFYFAGHGSQMWDTDGDEEDGLDETICPTDVIKGNTDRDIPDDELNRLLNRIPTDQITVVLDNCNAGTGTRAVVPFTRPRVLARDPASDLRKPANATAGQPVKASPASEVDGTRVLEISAARAGEVALDVDWPAAGGTPARAGGAFTTAFVRNLWLARPGSSYRDVFAATVADLNRQRFTQQPGISRTMTGAAFTPTGESASTTGGLAVIPVLRVQGNTVELGGGAAAGMTVGSLYGTGNTTLRITSVAPGHAQARLQNGRVAAGTRVRLIAHSFAPSVLRVSLADLSPASRSAIAPRLRALPNLQIVEDRQQFAHLLVRPGARGYQVLGMDGAQRHEVPAQKLDSLASIIAQENGAQQIALLENPGAAFQLRLGFTSGSSSFSIGQEIAFRITSERAGYLTLLDLGTDGRIVVLYPDEDSRDNRITAHGTITIPTAAMETMYEAQEPVGNGIVRAFVTERPLVLPFREGGAAEAAQVLTALRRAAGVTAADAPLPVSDWATAALLYTIAR